MTQRSLISLAEITELCDQLYERDGFVKWTDVAAAFDISRQAVHARLTKAVQAGQITEADYERWRSESSRRTQSRANEDLRREREKLKTQITLTPENKKWLMAQCTLKKATFSDLVNGMINKAKTEI